MLVFKKTELDFLVWSAIFADASLCAGFGRALGLIAKVSQLKNFNCTWITGDPYRKRKKGVLSEASSDLSKTLIIAKTDKSLFPGKVGCESSRQADWGTG